MSDDVLWEDGNSVFRPSYSDTWLNCAGALRPSQFAKDTAGIDAAIGTVFHWLMADWLQHGRPDSWLGQVMTVERNDGSEPFLITVDEEMFIYGEDCLAYVAPLKGDVFVETRVDISDLTPLPRQGGTADYAVCAPGVLDIVDWKYGIGVQVFPERNTQILLYAWGFFKEYDSSYHFERIRLHIAQPRLRHFDSWEITRDDLIKFAAFAKERAHGSWKRNADRTPSPKACQWCKVRLDCPALEIARQALADETFEVLDEPMTEAKMQEVITQPPAEFIALTKPLSLPTEHLARILQFRKLMEGWFSDIAEELTTRALQGEDVPGWKIVQGRSRRRWKDEAQAAERLSVFIPDDQLYVKKLVSPKQSEKFLQANGVKGGLLKEYLRTLAEQPPGKPTLSPAGDNRLELPNIIDASFEVIDEDEAAL